MIWQLLAQRLQYHNNQRNHQRNPGLLQINSSVPKHRACRLACSFYTVSKPCLTLSVLFPCSCVLHFVSVSWRLPLHFRHIVLQEIPQILIITCYMDNNVPRCFTRRGKQEETCSKEWDQESGGKLCPMRTSSGSGDIWLGEKTGRDVFSEGEMCSLMWALYHVTRFRRIWQKFQETLNMRKMIWWAG